jgi:hypothetical protein
MVEDTRLYLQEEGSADSCDCVIAVLQFKEESIESPRIEMLA